MTRFNGLQNIWMKLTNSGIYKLKTDSIRNIKTMVSPPLLSSFVPVSLTPNWTTFVSAVSLHWGMENFWDMLADSSFMGYARLSYDSTGKRMVAIFKPLSRKAVWHGDYASFGGAHTDNCRHQLVSLDIVGHEFAHGLIEFTAELLYNGEPGAINESISDIFGFLVEYHTDTAGINWDWLIAEDVFHCDTALRDMSNPNRFDQPATYLTDPLWDVNDEVHTNSGVHNYWFYLLANGGSGSNANDKVKP